MATNTTPTPPQDWLTNLSQRRRPLAYGFLGVAAAFAALAVVLFIKYREEYAVIGVWAGLLGAIALGGGVWLLLTEGQPRAESAEESRLLVLAVGGLAGFATWVLSLTLGFRWRETILGGTEAWQGEKWWQLWVFFLAMFGGLALIFVSLLPARAAERTNPGLRRLVYLFNAGLTGLLVLAILTVVNVLVYNYFPTSFDWTSSRIYSLSDRSKNILKALDKPTTVYVVMVESNDTTFSEVRTLMDNCRAVNDRLRVEYVPPDRSPARVRELQSTYQFNEREGLIVEYGIPGKAEHQVIKASEIFVSDPTSMRGPGSRPRFIFKGEDALMTALNALEEGKSKPVVYFTQGNGELDLNDFDSAPDGYGASELKNRLQKANYEVKGLQLGPGAGRAKGEQVKVANQVPADADIVVVAGPRNPLPDVALKALHDYMNPADKDASKKKAKMLVLTEVVLDPAKNQVRTGVEELVGVFNVQVGNDRVLCLPISNLNRGDPVKVPVVGTRRSLNPVAKLFSRGGFVLLPNVRTVQPRPTPPNMPPMANRFQAETLLVAPGQICWVETNLRADVSQVVESLLKNEKEQDEKLDQDKTHSVAVAVGEPQPPPANDPHAMMNPAAGGEPKPRLVVIGSASFASNAFTAESSGRPNYDLVASCLSWLRERPSSIGLEGKSREFFVLNPKPEEVTRMRWLPAPMMLLGVVVLGTGVWLIRRR
jgi:hypothetical protein